MKSTFLLALGMVSSAQGLFAQSNARIPNFDQYCMVVQNAFNTTPGGRVIPFKFINYKGFEQSSEAVFKVAGIDECGPGITKSFFSLTRTNGPDIQVGVLFQKLGNNEYQVNFNSSDCVRKFVEYARPRMIASGIQFEPQFDAAFQTNTSMEYCPKLEKAVGEELIKVLQQL